MDNYTLNLVELETQAETAIREECHPGSRELVTSKYPWQTAKRKSGQEPQDRASMTIFGHQLTYHVITIFGHEVSYHVTGLGDGETGDVWRVADP